MEKENTEFYYHEEKKLWGLNWRQWFLYFKLYLNPTYILITRTKRYFDKIIYIISLIFAISAPISLALFIFFNYENILQNPNLYLDFWYIQDFFISWFLISVWFILFLIYLNSQKKSKSYKFNYKRFLSSNVSKKQIDYNISNTLSKESLIVFEDAYLLAVKLKQNEVAMIHLFRSLLRNKDVQNRFIRLGVDASLLVEKIDRHLVVNSKEEFKGKTLWSNELVHLAVISFSDALYRRQSSVNPLNLLANSWSINELLKDIFQDLKISEDKLYNVVEWHFTEEKMKNRLKSWRHLAGFKPSSNMNRSYTAIATPTLDYFSHDLTLAAKYNRLDFCVGRKKELNNIFEILSSGQAGIMLVGQNGSGKKTIINGIAQLMVSEEVPSFLKDKRFLEIDVSRLVSGANPSVAQERLLRCIYEANKSGNVVLYINNIENIIGISAGQEQSLDLSEVLAEALSRRHIICLATVSQENYAKYIEGQALGDNMAVVGVAEPDFNQAVQILQSKVANLESFYGIFFSYSAIEKSVKLSIKYLHDKFLPAKAIDVLKLAASISAKASSQGGKKALCAGEEVSLAIAELTGIPVQKVTQDESEKLLNLEEEIHQRMIGQNEAVKAVSASLRRARVSIKSNKRPIASFLFLGPTGVGKTELAKTVSEIYFGGEEYMLRIDMSEYQRPDSVRKLIGDVDGTLGYLTEAVRKKPFALILFDEIEKAHPDILNLFLQMLDDGRLTDGQGRTINFSESIIIATSNIGAHFIQAEIKKESNVLDIKRELIDNRLQKYMRPELINRFDGIIVFTPLSTEDIFKIATLMLKGIKKNIAEKGIFMKADRDGVLVLAKKGYDPKYGARPLRRLLQEKVENVIANLILSGKLKRRDTVLINSLGKIEVEKAQDL